MNDPKLPQREGSLKAQMTGSFTARVEGKVYSKLPEDHPFYGMIGRVAALCADIEHTLDQIIWMLAELKDVQGACITSQMMGAGPRFRAIQLLCNLRNIRDEVINDIGTIAGHVQGSADARNRLVHDSWYTGTAGVSQFRSMPSNKPEFGFVPITDKEIEKTLADVSKHQEEVLQLKRRIQDALKKN
ncbi:MAG: hypothetical protein H6887_09605 [Hoeflea sp.]|nr:hypothetical protein [Hoeflea sp.]